MSMCRGECAPIVAGLVLGLSGAFCLAPALFGSPFETNPRDAMTYAAVAVLMAGVAVSATFVPLRRAGKTDPIEALRAAS
jgi:ABC-type antimicrobial peptide transport system permease subunit